MLKARCADFDEICVAGEWLCKYAVAAMDTE
jgi:hypothetical protein